MPFRCKIFGHKLDPASLDYGIAYCECCQAEQENLVPGLWEFWYARLRWRIAGWREDLWRWFRPCSDCGRRLGRHDEKVDHIPF